MKNLSGVLHDKARGLALQGFMPHFGQPRLAPRPDPEWRKLRQLGTELWLDTGDVQAAAELWNAEFSALTTNNTLLNAEIQKGLYDSKIPAMAQALREADPGLGERELVLELAFILNAYHGLRLVEEFDAMVSVELHTDLAHDVDRSVSYGRRYYAICPERFYIKVPLTPAGLLAARRLEAEGIPVNLTLGFSARQNLLAAHLAQPHFVNVFMGRLNAFVADHGLGDGVNVGEKAVLATQRTVRLLRSEGGGRSRLIAASMRDGPQVEALAGVDVYTMPPKVAAQYRSHPAASLSSRVAHDPPVQWAKSDTAEQANVETLWDVPEAFRRTVDRVMAHDVDSLRPDDLTGLLAETGGADLFPDWSQEERSVIARDGKIPVFAAWKERLASKAIGLDALMNVSALVAFTKDQAALDARIRGLLA